ncbi:MAG: hypothetical protein LUG18_16040 [Candidatus Azobacteroides sp.]|nr:hypothetical protein [Candidatus Azobacteroides sp.]
MKKLSALFLLLLYSGSVLLSAQETDTSASFSGHTVFSGLEAKHFRLRGYAHILYQYAEKEEVESKFTAQRAIVIANGILTDQLDYLLMYDFGMNSMLHELWLRYKILPGLEITAGQQKVPLTLESIISPSLLECVRMSMITTNLVGIGKGTDVINAHKSNAGRDLGVQIGGQLFPSGNHYLLDYRIGIFNGSGINVADNNNHKDFAAWFLLYPFKEWAIGGSAYIGKGHYQAVGKFEEGDYKRN